MKPVQLPLLAILSGGFALGQTPETHQRITSGSVPTVSYDIGVTGSDQTFAISRDGNQRLKIDASGNTTVLANLTVNGTFLANAFSGSSISGGTTGLLLNAGGSNQSITLSPSGTGNVLIPTRWLGIGVGAPNRALDFKNGSWVLANVNLSANSYYGAAGDNGVVAFSGNQSALSVFNTNASFSDSVAEIGALRTKSDAYWLLRAYAGNGTTSAFDNQLFGIRGDGRVGIGTNAPSATLHVAGTTLISDDTATSSTTAGALVVTGGVGIGGGLNVAGNVEMGIDGDPEGGSLLVRQAARIKGDLYVDGKIHLIEGQLVADNASETLRVMSPSESTAYTNGALIVEGGVGIAKNLNVNGTVNAIGGVRVNGQSVWHAGNLNPSLFVQQTGGGVANFSVTGVLSGGSSGLTLHSGTTNNTIRLVTSGTGRVEIANTLAITETTGIQHLLMGNQDGGGMANPVILRAFDGDLQLGSGDSWSAQGGTFTANVTFTDDGKVGIGTSNPGFPLTVINGSSTAPQIAFGQSETGAVRMIAGSTGDFALIPKSGRMVINGLVDGAVGSNPIGRLEVRDGTTAFGSGDYGLVIRARTAAAHANANLLAVGSNATTGWEQFVIKGNGNALFGTATDSSNGRIQLSTHTTRAGGLAWGDTYAYRSATGRLYFGDGTTDAIAIESRWNGNASGHAGVRGMSTTKDFHIGTSTGRTLFFDVGTTSRAELTASQLRLLTGVPLRVEDTTASSSATSGALVVAGGAGIGGQLTANGLATPGSLLVGGTSILNAITASGIATFNNNVNVPTSSVGLGTTQPIQKLHVNEGGMAITGSGGVLHLADGYSDGSFGVRLSGRNGGQGHDFVVWTRTTAGGSFAEAFTVKPSGESKMAKQLDIGGVDGGRLRLLNSTGAWWGLNNDAGTLKIFRESTSGTGSTPVLTFDTSNVASFFGPIDARGHVVKAIGLPTTGTDAANKLYVDSTQPFHSSATDVSLKNPAQWLALGSTYADAPLHVKNSGYLGEIARFSNGGVLNNLANRSFIRIDNQNPSFWWELSVQDEMGGGTQNGFALRARHPLEGVSKSRLYVNPAASDYSSSRSFLRLYNQNPDSAWEFSLSSNNSFSLHESYNDLTQFLSSAARLHIESGTGNVGIGTTLPGAYKLAVNGGIRAKEIVIETANWPDYVFGEGYERASLAEIEEHIKTHKHLPGVPSAAEVSERGVAVGEMQVTLLRKVEELTLHLIEQGKRIERLEAENSRLKALSVQ